MSLVEDARALMMELLRSPYADVHVRTPDGEIFLAKPNGRASPLREVTPRERTLVSAPHLAKVREVAAIGTSIEAGAVVASLSVLDQIIEVKSEEAGVVAETHAQVGELVEYESPLVSLFT